jgi:hypothetical protein
MLGDEKKSKAIDKDKEKCINVQQIIVDVLVAVRGTFL